MADPSVSPDKECTVKELDFSQFYIENQGNASEAYRLAYSPKNAKPETIWSEASRVLGRPHVHARIKELLAGNLIRHEMTVNGITEMLREDRELARDNKQSSAAVTASMGLAKMHGLIVEHKKVEATLTLPNIHTQLYGDDA